MDKVSLLGLVAGFLIAAIFLTKVGIFRGERAWGVRYGAIAFALLYLVVQALNSLYFLQAFPSVFGDDLRHIFYFRPMGTGTFLGVLVAAVIGFFQEKTDK